MIVSSISLIFSKISYLLVCRVYFLVEKESQILFTFVRTLVPDSMIIMKAVRASTWIDELTESATSFGMLNV